MLELKKVTRKKDEAKSHICLPCPIPICQPIDPCYPHVCSPSEFPIPEPTEE